jgi:hypothetical protein
LEVNIMAANNIIINRNTENAAHSTGPRTEEGKAVSSQNGLKHGLASGTLLIPGEDPAAYEALVADFIAQHQPQTPGEEIAITDMAHAWWLKTRAIALQNRYIENEKMLPLYLRYQAAHERAYYRALAELRKLKKERPEVETGFASQEDEDAFNLDALRQRLGIDVLRKLLDYYEEQDQNDESVAQPDSEIEPIQEVEEENEDDDSGQGGDEAPSSPNA